MLRERDLCFGPRVICPFLRPFFLDERQAAAARRVGEAVARLGERVAASVDVPEVLDVLAVTDAERALAALDAGPGPASTASRLDAFVLDDHLVCAEYNAESPAGLGYAERLGEVFQELDVTARFREAFDVSPPRLMRPMLETLLETYREWGGTASPPVVAIVDFRGVPTWAEFEMLQAAFTEAGVPTLVCDPRELEFDGRTLTAQGRRIDLVYRRVLVGDVREHPDECRALVDACAARAVCMANAFRCKLPHKKSFFALLTDERFARLFDPADLEAVAGAVPWTRLLREGMTTLDGGAIDLVPYVRANRERLVIKPNDEYGGSGVLLGWEADERAWDERIRIALGGDEGAWVVQARIGVRREPFPLFGPDGTRMQEMLVDCAPYLFRGRLTGFLTRLSASGLANVTSGGGQVPAFVVRAK
ncbi:MAG TPA: hypothetical protein VF198_10035 [Vicinamibacterales bacterium]